MSIEKTIRDLISEHVEGFDGHELKAETKFLDAGMDSLDLATVLLEVQEELGVTLPDGDEDSYDTLNKLVAYVEAKKAEA